MTATRKSYKDDLEAHISFSGHCKEVVQKLLWILCLDPNEAEKFPNVNFRLI